MMGGAAPPASPGWRRRVASAARWALLWVPLGFWLGFARPWVPSNPCWLRQEGPVQVAPDGSVAIQMEHEVCEYGFLITELVTRLKGWRVSSPEQRHTLAVWERSGANDDRVKVTWTGAGALHLSLTMGARARIDAAPLAGLGLTMEQPPPTVDSKQRPLR